MVKVNGQEYARDIPMSLRRTTLIENVSPLSNLVGAETIEGLGSAIKCSSFEQVLHQQDTGIESVPVMFYILTKR